MQAMRLSIARSQWFCKGENGFGNFDVRRCLLGRGSDRWLARCPPLPFRCFGCLRLFPLSRHLDLPRLYFAAFSVSGELLYIMQRAADHRDFPGCSDDEGAPPGVGGTAVHVQRVVEPRKPVAHRGGRQPFIAHRVKISALWRTIEDAAFLPCLTLCGNPSSVFTEACSPTSLA